MINMNFLQAKKNIPIWSSRRIEQVYILCINKNIWKTNKKDWRAGKKQIDAIVTQNDSWNETDDMKLEGAKKLENGFKPNMNKISRGRNESEWHKKFVGKH